MTVLLSPVQRGELSELDSELGLLVPYLMDAVLSARCASRYPGFLCATGLALGSLAHLPHCSLGHPQIASACVMGPASSLGGLR